MLPAVLLCLLALTAVAYGVLAAARHQRLAARTRVVLVQARLASEAGVRRGAAALDEGVLEELRRGGTVRLPAHSLGADVEARSIFRRVRPEWIWIEGEGRVGRHELEVERSTAAAFWVLEAPARIGALRAGLEHGAGVRSAGGGSIAGSDAVGSPADWPPEVCDPRVPLLDSLLGPGGLDSTAPFAELPLPLPEDGSRLDSVPRLGLLNGRGLAGVPGGRRAGARASPVPVVRAGVCDTLAAENWGAPSDPLGRCGSHLPLIVAPASLVVEGGEGQGILAVAGDLTLTREARFAGVVLVGGVLRVASGSLLQGAVRLRGGAVVSGAIEASPCAALRALEARPELARPVPAPGGGWISLD